MHALRTPEDRFTDLPRFPWPPSYASTPDGLRVAYLDEGPADAEVVLLIHGEPTWSYLYRRMVPVFLAAGYRVVAPDLVGFGRSDKPGEVAEYTYARHVEWMRSVLFDTLGLTGITLVGQDWGGLIGLRLVAEHPERFDRVCAANTGLPDGSRRLPDAWWQFRDFVATAAELPVGRLVAGGVVTPLPEEVVAAYDAPFPDETYKAGARAFPDLIPQSPDNPATPDNQRAWAVLERFEKPFLCAYSDRDPITAGADRPFRSRVPGAAGQPHTTVEGAGHFIQEDQGPALATLIVDWAGR
jgi:haloalkane dehalogenase